MKVIALLFLLFITSLSIMAQEEDVKLKLRHIKGIYGFEMNAGLNKYGKQFSFGYAQYESGKFIGRIIFNSESGKINLTNYTTNAAFIGFDHTIFKIKEKVFFNGGYGGFAGWETTANEILNRKAETFSFGLYLDANSEIYLFNTLSAIVEFKEIFDKGSPLGAFRYYANCGFRYYL